MKREIPTPTKCAVRQECAFGCIFCGEAIYEYHHIVPWKKIRYHAVPDIALLCGSHHEKVTRGMIAEGEVRAMRLKPYRLSHRWPHTLIHPYAERFPIKLGGAEFLSPRTVLRILGRNLLSIREPEHNDGPIRLSAAFYDDNGKRSLVIDDNECRFNPHSWDIESKGGCFTVRSAPRDIALRIRLSPERFAVERLKMQYRGVKLVADEKKLKVISSDQESYTLAGWVNSPDVGIEIKRKHLCNNIKVSEPRRSVHIHGRGGRYSISGRQPAGTDAIKFSGGAESLVVNVDGKVEIGGHETTESLGFALSEPWAIRLGLGDLEILIGAGAHSHAVSLC